LRDGFLSFAKCSPINSDISISFVLMIKHNIIEYKHGYNDYLYFMNFISKVNKFKFCTNLPIS